MGKRYGQLGGRLTNGRSEEKDPGLGQLEPRTEQARWRVYRYRSLSYDMHFT